MKNIIFALSIVLFGVSSTFAITTEFFNHSSFLNNTSDLTVIGFDSTPRGTLQGNEFQSDGLLITHRDGDQIVVGIDTGSNTLNSFANGLSSSFYDAAGNRSFTNSVQDNFDFTLIQTANSAGLFIGNIGPGSTSVQFLRADLSVIAEETFLQTNVNLIGSTGGDFNNRIFYGVVTDEQIAIIRTIEGSNDSDGILYDDIQFDVGVPEPGSWILISLGLGTFLLKRRSI